MLEASVVSVDARVVYFFFFFYYSLLIRRSGLFSFRINLRLWSLYTVGRTPCSGDQPCNKATTNTGQHKRRRNADRHPCLEWDSNPWSQCLSGRKHFMPYIVLPLWLAYIFLYYLTTFSVFRNIRLQDNQWTPNCEILEEKRPWSNLIPIRTFAWMVEENHGNISQYSLSPCWSQGLPNTKQELQQLVSFNCINDSYHPSMPWWHESLNIRRIRRPVFRCIIASQAILRWLKRIMRWKFVSTASLNGVTTPLLRFE
jgi:hypothetical protein